MTIKCKSCKSDFEPIYRNGIIASRLCLSCLITKGKDKIRKEKQREHRKAKEKLKTHSDWLRDCQVVFNKYIRLRDRNMPCISCGKSLNTKYDAGHFLSVGSNPNLRFNEDNVHGQCVECNQHLHGNILEYSIKLPKRIGLDRYNTLLSLKGTKSKLTIEEIKEKINYYKQKNKELEK